MNEKERGIRQRCLFAAILAGLLNGGGAEELLDGRSPEERKQMAEAWDAWQHTAVGEMFMRPDFENLKTNSNGKSNKKRFKEHGSWRNARV